MERIDFGLFCSIEYRLIRASKLSKNGVPRDRVSTQRLATLKLNNNNNNKRLNFIRVIFCF